MKNKIFLLLFISLTTFAQEFTMEFNGTSTNQNGVTATFSTGAFSNSGNGTEMTLYDNHPYGTPINGGNDYSDITISPATYISRITVAWAYNTQNFELRFMKSGNVVATLGNFNAINNITSPTNFNVGQVVDVIRFYDTGYNNSGGFELKHLTFDSALPVELVSFSALVLENNVNLNWQTATEVNNYGFEIEKTKNNAWEKIGFVEGHGNSNSPKEYSFIDESTQNGKYSYRLKQIDFDGKFEYSSVVEVDFKSMNDFALEQNYPNPFNPTTMIKYSVPTKEFVSLKIYDILGNKVADLVNENKEAGNYEVSFDASNYPSGLYIYSITAGSFKQVRKMMLVK